MDDRAIEHVAHFRRWWIFRAEAPELRSPAIWQKLQRWWRGY
jgi:hypothetical protein